MLRLCSRLLSIVLLRLAAASDESTLSMVTTAEGHMAMLQTGSVRTLSHHHTASKRHAHKHNISSAKWWLSMLSGNLDDVDKTAETNKLEDALEKTTTDHVAAESNLEATSGDKTETKEKAVEVKEETEEKAVEGKKTTQAAEQNADVNDDGVTDVNDDGVTTADGNMAMMQTGSVRTLSHHHAASKRHAHKHNISSAKWWLSMLSGNLDDVDKTEETNKLEDALEKTTTDHVAAESNLAATSGDKTATKEKAVEVTEDTEEKAVEGKKTTQAAEQNADVNDDGVTTADGNMAMLQTGSVRTVSHHHTPSKRHAHKHDISSTGWWLSMLRGNLDDVDKTEAIVAEKKTEEKEEAKSSTEEAKKDAHVEEKKTEVKKDAEKHAPPEAEEKEAKVAEETKDAEEDTKDVEDALEKTTTDDVAAETKLAATSGDKTETKEKAAEVKEETEEKAAEVKKTPQAAEQNADANDDAAKNEPDASAGEKEETEANDVEAKKTAPTADQIKKMHEEVLDQEDALVKEEVAAEGKPAASASDKEETEEDGVEAKKTTEAAEEDALVEDEDEVAESKPDEETPSKTNAKAEVVSPEKKKPSVAKAASKKAEVVSPEKGASRVPGVGSTSSLDEKGFKKVFHSQDKAQMANFVHRVLKEVGLLVSNEDGLKKFVEKAHPNSFDALAKELTESAAAKKDSWVCIVRPGTEDFKNQAFKSLAEPSLGLGLAMSLNQEGYEAVSQLKNSAEMDVFVHRVVNHLGLEVKNLWGLLGTSPYYSGATAKQSFAALTTEIQTKSLLPDAWVAVATQER